MPPLKVISFIFLLSSASANAAYKLSETFTLPPPPAVGTVESKEDYTTLHDLQKTRTAAQCKIANSQTMMSPESFFGPKTGLLTPIELRTFLIMYEDVRSTAEAVALPFKEQYLRIRPYDADSTLHPCVQKPKGAKSYPSSHAAAGRLLARVLSEIFPERTKELLVQGDQIGENRLIGGVHHPSDVEAGRELADEIFPALQKNAQYVKDLAEVKNSLDR